MFQRTQFKLISSFVGVSILIGGLSLIVGWQIIDQVVRRIAAHANSKLPKDQQIQLNPHLLRHTALRRWADKKGIRYARQISGQVSDRYIWRYTQPSRQETRDAVEELWD